VTPAQIAAVALAGGGIWATLLYAVWRTF